MTPRSALDIIWARLSEAIGDKITAAADSADKAENQAGVATTEANRAKTEADNAASAAAAEVDKLTAGAPEAFDTFKEISDELEKNETERAALATTIGKKADRGHTHASEDITDSTYRSGWSQYAYRILRADGEGWHHLPEDPTIYSHPARKSYVDKEVAKKADPAYVDSAVSGKATKSEVDEALGKKANTSYVDQELGKKATKSEVSKKADTSYVDQELGKKADSDTVNSRPAFFHGHGPPGAIEGAVPGDKYMDLDEMEIYVLPEENA